MDAGEIPGQRAAEDILTPFGIPRDHRIVGPTTPADQQVPGEFPRSPYQQMPADTRNLHQSLVGHPVSAGVSVQDLLVE